MDIDQTNHLETDTPFDEDWYLRYYGDIAEAVGRGGFPSGKYHYDLHGRHEGRMPVPPVPGGEPEGNGLTPPFQNHNGSRFLTPVNLEVSQTPLRRVAFIGSCLMSQWGFQNANPSGCPVDLITVNNAVALPDVAPKILESYDFAVIQVPLRPVVTDDLLWHLPYADAAAHEEAFHRACANLEYQLHLWMQWNRERGLLTFVVNFPLPQQNPMGRLFPKYSYSNPEYFVDRLNECLERIVRSNKNAFVFDLDRIFASVGRRYVQDDIIAVTSHGGPLGQTPVINTRIEPMASMVDHYEFRPTHLWSGVIWSELLAMYRTVHQIDSVKVVVVDLDDTLWNGVSGDIAEINGFMIEGWPIGFAEALMYLKKRGILLAIASKNEESRIREIWPRIFGDRFRLDDFAAIRINWLPKAENVRDILEGMNLLPRNAVFIDDNPAERQAMRAAFPEIRVLGRYPYYLRRSLLWAPETQVALVTEESSRRTEMIQAQFSRETKRKEMSREQFLRNAAPKITFLPVNGTDHPRFGRVLELINKTNQFNTNGRRWKLEELQEHFLTGGQMIAFEVTDRFTSYGLVGVVMFRPGVIVQWVMSCRVLGYQIEEAVMATVVEGMRAARPGPVTGSLIHTDVNFPCRDLFSKCGFTDANGSGEWVLADDATPTVPKHVTITE
jgi:FkbH-like protein